MTTAVVIHLVYHFNMNDYHLQQISRKVFDLSLNLIHTHCGVEIGATNSPPSVSSLSNTKDHVVLCLLIAPQFCINQTVNSAVIHVNIKR